MVSGGVGVPLKLRRKSARRSPPPTPDKSGCATRRLLEEFEQIYRPSASEGEREAAEWMVERFGELGAEARIEAEPAHGTYWWPLGLGAAWAPSAACGAARTAAARRRAGRVGAAGIADDFPPGQAAPAQAAAEAHHLQRRLRIRARRGGAHDGHRRPPRRRPLGPDLPPRAAQARRPPRPDRGAGHQPAADGAGGRRSDPGRARRPHRAPPARQAGHLPRPRHGAAMADIGSRKTVPGANDNGTARRRPAGAGPAPGRGAARGHPRDPALGRRRGVLQRGDQGLRRAPLPASCRGRAPSSSPSTRSAPRTCSSCAARAS